MLYYLLRNLSTLAKVNTNGLTLIGASKFATGLGRPDSPPTTLRLYLAPPELPGRLLS